MSESVSINLKTYKHEKKQLFKKDNKQSVTC